MQADKAHSIRPGYQAVSGAAIEDLDDSASKFLTFDIANRIFAVEVTRVREILDMQEVTPLPNSPHQVEGVVDVRGVSIPIVNMSGALGASSDPMGEDSRIIVFETPSASDKLLTVGVVADRVRDVCQIEANEIEAPPDFGDSALRPGAVTGMCRLEGGLVVIIDLSHVFAEMGLAL
ncbi:chemotaxis protein CheW [Aestuariivita boseongensis]|uniref:chemotaxis protein CheW n=1 Tax=Aestuariivita boseongensis TaxID=1470562 RepID=UPI000680C2A1|nr:chemotaxis protein CheW [Aestuariivita boseongensis]